MDTQEITISDVISDVIWRDADHTVFDATFNGVKYRNVGISAGAVLPNAVRHYLSTGGQATEDLASIKSDLVSKVKAKAAEVRDRYRTPGKDLVYAEKKDQAHAVLDMGQEAANALRDHGAATFPLLAGTVGVEAPTLFDLAQLVWNKYEQWNALAYVIERNEIGGARAISVASDAAAARAAYEALTWPT